MFIFSTNLHAHGVPSESWKKNENKGQEGKNKMKKLGAKRVINGSSHGVLIAKLGVQVAKVSSPVEGRSSAQVMLWIICSRKHY